MKEKHQKLSIFISLILRHKPEVIGVTVGNTGFVNVNELIDGINNNSEYNITMDILKEIVDSDVKKRYSFNKDYTEIRANQGHSIKVNVELDEIIPPRCLYHGTSKRVVGSILSEGISRKARLYVHLSSDLKTAIDVGSRHGEPVVFHIDSLRMHNDGYKFYKSENGVYLVELVPPKYIRCLQTI